MLSGPVIWPVSVRPRTPQIESAGCPGGEPPIPGYNLWLPFDTDASPRFSANGISTPTPTVDGLGSLIHEDTLVKQAVINTLRVGRLRQNGPWGAMIEQAATNRLWYSDDATQVPWDVFGPITVSKDGTADPSGGTGAVLVNKTSSIVPDTYLYQNVAAIGGVTNKFWTIRAWVRAGTLDKVSFEIWDTSTVPDPTPKASTGKILSGPGSVNNTGTHAVFSGLTTSAWTLIEILTDTTLSRVNPHDLRIVPGDSTHAGTIYLWRTTFCDRAATSLKFSPTDILTAGAATVRADDVGLVYASTDFGAGAFTLYGLMSPLFNCSTESAAHIIATTLTGADGVTVHTISGTCQAIVRTGAVSNSLNSAKALIAQGVYSFGLAVAIGDDQFIVYDPVAQTFHSAVGAWALPAAHGNLGVGMTAGSQFWFDGMIRDPLLYPSRHSEADMQTMLPWLTSRAA